jgi:death-on-curing family protein
MPSHRIRYPSLVVIIEINRSVVSLTKDEHSFDEYDRSRLSQILDEMKTEGENPSVKTIKGRIVKKASYLMFRLASGQHFHEGNKRTAIVATATFLAANGFVMPQGNPAIERLLDKIAIGSPDVDIRQLESVMEGLVVER